MPALGNALGLPFQRRGVSFVGPLDTLSTGLVGAWSVARRLLANYNNAWLRVRRSSDNAELDCTTVASILAFCGAGNGFVVTVYDQTGNGRDLTQSTAGNQAQIVTSGALTAGLNGLAAMRNHNGSCGYRATIGARTPTAASYAFVGVPCASGGYNGQVGNPSAAFAPNGAILLYNPSDTTLQDYIAFGTRGNALTIAAGAAVAAGVEAGPSNVTHYKSGVANTPGAYTPTFNYSEFGIWFAGGTVGGTGTINATAAEMILWDGARSSALATLGAEQKTTFDL